MTSFMEDFRGKKYREHEQELREKGIIAEGTVNNFKKPKKMKSKELVSKIFGFVLVTALFISMIMALIYAVILIFNI